MASQKKPKYLFKYYPDHNSFPEALKTKCLSALNDPYFFCSPVDNFNDPFEMRLQVSLPKNDDDWLHLFQLQRKQGLEVPSDEELMDSYIERNRARVREVFSSVAQQAVAEFRNKTRVCCFSEVGDSILMWAHYAMQHKGHCLKLDPSITEMSNHIFPVLYSNGDKFPKFTVYDLGTDYKSKVFGHKHKGWKYEKEWRIATQDCEGIFYDKASIIEVLIGYRASEDLEEELAGLFPDAKITRVTVAKESYKLNID